MREEPPPSARSIARPLNREQRLAAKLRENLRRRKTQARDTAQDMQDSGLSKAEPDS